MATQPVFSVERTATGTTTCITNSTDEILTAIVYTCIEIDEPVLCKSGILDIDLERSTKIKSALQSMYEGPTGHLGHLDKLPSELIVQIFSYLDLSSVLAIRRVSRAARQVVASSKQFKILTAYAVDVLWTLVRLRLGDKYTLSQIDKALRETQCSICRSSLGIFIFVPLLERTCSGCRSRQRRFTVIRRKALLLAVSASSANKYGDWPMVQKALYELKTFSATVSATRWPDSPAKVENDMLLYSDALRFCGTPPSLRETYDRMQTMIGYSQMMALTGSIEGLFVAALPYDQAIDGVQALRACNECAFGFVNLVRGRVEYTPDGWPFQVGKDSPEHRQKCMIAQQLRAHGDI